jgi:hypothetical protein
MMDWVQVEGLEYLPDSRMTLHIKNLQNTIYDQNGIYKTDLRI